jgi:hypothetical protein
MFGSMFGVRSSARIVPIRARDSNVELRRKNTEPNPEPEHELRSENREA